MSGERINTAIVSLINGVSQQPSTTRLGSQCDEQVNGYSSVVDGVRKRPPLRHIAKLMEGDHSDAFVHIINRDLEERYVAFVSQGDLRVYDILNGGAEVSVAFPNGKGYLASGKTRQDFAMVTVADHTFVANKTIKTRMCPDRTPPPVNEAIAYVKRGYVSTTYKVLVDTTWVSYTTPDPYSKTTENNTVTTNVNTQPSTEEIAKQLTDGVNTVDGFVAENLGSCLRIWRTDGADFAFKVTDSWGEEALLGVKRDVNKNTDLPAKCWDGVRVRVTGENKDRADDVYYEYNSEGATKNGIWEECRGWDQLYKIDATTMPHLLVREKDGTFTFKQAEWDEAWVGDEYSADCPSFIDCAIADIFFYRGRLGIIADESIILSRHHDYYNFWPKTATTVVATDPIDVATSHIKVSLLRHAVPFKESLLLFSDQTQFQMSDGGTANLSPETVRVDPTTEIECSRRCKPMGAGRNVFFITERGDNSAVREYRVAADNVGNDAEDITSHVSRYIPKGVHKMIASSNEDVLMLLSTEKNNQMWVYKYFWIDEEKAQSSWSRWEFPVTDNILSIGNIETELFVIMQRPDGVYLDKIELQSTKPEDGLAFQIHLDRRVLVSGVYDEASGQTVWSLPYTDTEPLAVVLGGGFKKRGGRELSNLVQTGDTIRAEGDFSQAPCFIGRQYTFRYTFSEQHLRESKELAAPVVKEGRLQLLNFTVLHHNSGYFRSEVTSKGRDTVVKEHLGTIGDLNFLTGRPVIDSVPHRFGVLARSDQVKVELVNDKHYPSNFQSAEWTGTFIADARRI